eukprot:scaffold79046_cov63-Phaeocystis_antarctica.AAC.2
MLLQALQHEVDREQRGRHVELDERTTHAEPLDGVLEENAGGSRGVQGSRGVRVELAGARLVKTGAHVSADKVVSLVDRQRELQDGNRWVVKALSTRHVDEVSCLIDCGAGVVRDEARALEKHLSHPVVTIGADGVVRHKLKLECRGGPVEEALVPVASVARHRVRKAHRRRCVHLHDGPGVAALRYVLVERVGEQAR